MGFTYWGYRKCYGAAAVLAVVFFALCLLCAHIRSVIPMVAFMAICGAAFNPYYRSRICRKVNRPFWQKEGLSSALKSACALKEAQIPWPMALRQS